MVEYWKRMVDVAEACYIFSSLRRARGKTFRCGLMVVGFKVLDSGSLKIV